MSEPVKYVGWKKSPGGAWQKVPGAESDTQLGCMSLLEKLCMLAVGEDLHDQYFVLPEGQTPEAQRDRSSYLHRSMRPGWGI